MTAWRSVLALAWPVMLQQWLVLAVALSDRVLSGRFQPHLSADDQAATQAAQTTAQYLGWFLSSTAVLVNAGASAVVAQRVGAKDADGANAVLHQALGLALVVGLVGSAAIAAGLSSFLWLLRLDAESAGFASAYLFALLPSLPLHLIGAAGTACLAGAGDTRTGMWVYGSEAVINVPLAWAGFHLFGFVGIAAGTAVAQALGGIAVLILLSRGRAGLRLSWQNLTPDRVALREVLDISVPAAIDSLSMQAGYLAFLSQVNAIGPTAAAAHGIALIWEAMGYLTGVGFGTAAMTLVGQARGAGRVADANEAAWTAFGLGAVAMSLMGVVFFTLAAPMFRLLCPYETQADIVAQGVPVLRLVAFGMPALAACMIFVQALRGAGDARTPLLFTWLGFFGVRLPLTVLLLNHGWGLFGAWLAMNADMHVRGTCLLLRWASGRWARKVGRPVAPAGPALDVSPP